MGVVDDHGAFERKQFVVGRVRVFKSDWSMARGPLKRKKTLVGKVRVSKWGWSRVMGTF